jgi:hypothetical protein
MFKGIQSEVGVFEFLRWLWVQLWNETGTPAMGTGALVEIDELDWVWAFYNLYCLEKRMQKWEACEDISRMWKLMLCIYCQLQRSPKLYRVPEKVVLHSLPRVYQVKMLFHWFSNWTSHNLFPLGLFGHNENNPRYCGVKGACEEGLETAFFACNSVKKKTLFISLCMF